jgi:diguanylate cyclase (GGDEF)-like protein
VTENVSESLASIEAAIAANWAAGLVALVVSQLVLAILLWRPLSRLRMTAETLPMLGRGEFTAARDKIAARQRGLGSLLPDESDLLDGTATSLSYRLEALETQVRRRTKELRERASEIRQERDFGQRLLDTAQAIIVTLDSKGRIININGFGRHLLASQPGKGDGPPTIYEVCADELDVRLFRGALAYIVDAGVESFDHTSSILSTAGERRDIAWRHSRLKVDRATVAMLSVGLDVTDQRRAEKRVAWLADHDPLTELFNRRRFRRELAGAVERAELEGGRGCLLYLDLDQFKFINDTAGHAIGDSLLKAVAEALNTTIGPTGVTGRLSGDEFAVLLPHASQEQAIELANAIRFRLRQIHIDVGGRPQRITTSIGIAVYPEHAVDEDDLLAIADLAMYQAKAAGRDGFAVYSTEAMGRQYMKDLLEVKTLVDEALAEGGLEFHYQPILDLFTGRCSHVEALLRLKLNQGGHMLPREFIGVAERTGAIRQIDNHVLRLAAVEIERFAELGLDLQVSINQSAFALADPFFYDSVAELARDHPSARGRLVFEITESAAVTNLAATSIALTKVRALGFQVALDDFGTGFSSLSHLKHLPVDYIKIDGVFVQDVVDKPDDQVLLAAVIKLATMYGKKTIAEHVSRDDVLEWVRARGVDYAQGFVVAQPMPFERLREFLAEAALAEKR